MNKKIPKPERNRGLLLGAVCGLLSLGLDFILIPLLCTAVADAVWMLLMVALPLAAALLLFRRSSVRTGFAAAGLPVQYVLLLCFSRPLAGLWGFFPDDVLGMWPFLLPALGWPALVTCVQFAGVFLMRKLSGGSQRGK